MYELIHRHKKIAVIVIGVATFGFLLWLFVQGSFQDFTSGGRCVAEVNDSCITYRDYRRELLRYSHLLENKEFENVVKERVLESLIVQTLLYQKAESMGFRASDEEVVQTVKSDPTFHENGVFSSYKYKEILARGGLEPQEYEEYIRKLLSTQKLLALIQNAVYMTEEESRINLSVSSMELSGKLYLLTPADVKEVIEPTEKEMLEYYEKNKDAYRTEEKKIIQVWVEKDKERASDIYKELKAGKDVSGFTQYELPKDAESLKPEVLKLAERLSQSDPITITKVGQDYYVVKLYKLEKGGIKSFNEVKEEVKKALIENKKLEVLSSRAQSYAQALRRGESVNLRYFTFENTPISQIASLMRIDSKDLINIAFSNEKVFGPYSLAQGYGILYVESRKEGKQEVATSDASKNLLTLKGSSLTNAYIEHLLKNSKVKINREML